MIGHDINRRFRGRLGEWQIEPERCAATWFGNHSHGPAHPGDRFLKDGQADAGATLSLIQLFKDPENFLVLITRDADSGVAHE